MRLQKLIFACALSAIFCFKQYALAQPQLEEKVDSCSATVVNQIAEQLGLGKFSADYNLTKDKHLVRFICESWPAYKSRTIMTFAWRPEKADDGNVQLYLAVIENSSHKIIASSISVDGIQEDGTNSLNNLQLDPQQYVLSQNAQIFGIRVDTFNMRCTYDGGEGYELRLFAVEGKKIHQVLKQTMSKFAYPNGNSCSEENRPYVEGNIQISVEKTKSNGFADLKLTGIRSDNKKPINAIVKYDGDKYDVEQWWPLFGNWMLDLER